MKIVLNIVCLFSILFLSGCKKHNTVSFDGKTLIGFETIKVAIDPEQPQYNWLYKTKIAFKKDSVFIEKSPISVYKKDTLYSASDGGFYSYKGIWNETNDKFEINVIETNCDNCPEAMQEIRKGVYQKVIRKKDYKGKRTKKGLNLNGIEFNEQTILQTE